MYPAATYRAATSAFAALIALVIALISTPARACDTVGGCTGNELHCAGGGARTPYAQQIAFDGAAFTVEFWFSAPPPQGRASLVAAGDPATGALLIDLDSSGRIVLTVAGTSGYLARISSVPGLAGGAWHHVAVVRDSGLISLYIDGSLSGGTTFAVDDSIHSATGIGLGCADTARGVAGLNGSLDEVRVWAMPIDSARLACSRFDRLTGAEPLLVAYYPFDDLPGRTVTCDRSPYQNNAQLEALASITAPTRTVPAPVSALEDSLTLVAQMCGDTAFGVVRLVSPRACGATIDSVVFGGPDGGAVQFVVQPPTTVPPNDTVTLSLRTLVAPTMRRAQIAVYGHGCPDPVFVNLSAAPLQRAQLALDRDTMPFGACRVDSSYRDSIHLRNAGNAPDTVRIAITGRSFSCDTTDSIIIQPGGDTTLVVTFAPTDTLRATGALHLFGSACDSAYMVMLTGQGVASPPPPTFEVCAPPIVMNAGEFRRVDLVASPLPPLPDTATLHIAINYDARKIWPVNVSSQCLAYDITDTVAPDGRGRFEFTLGLLKFLESDTIASLFVISMAPDSAASTVNVAATVSPAVAVSQPCTSPVTILPRCDIAGVRYTGTSSIESITPHPVDGVSTITVVAGEKARLCVTVTDALGRCIATLFDAGVSPGHYIATLDANALHLLPGTYCVRMDLGTSHESRTIVVMR